MTDQHPFNFKIDRDEDRGEDALFQPEIADDKLEVLRRRLTRVTILILCFICVLLALVYFDMKKRFIIAEGSGEEKAQALSKNIESSYSDLSLRFTEFEESIRNSLSDFKKETASLKGDLAKANASIASIDGKKPDKEEIKTALADITRQVETIKQQVEALGISGKNLESSIGKSMESFSAALNASGAEISGIKKSVSDVAASAVSKKDLEAALKAESERRRRETAGLSEELQKKITDAQIIFKNLEKRLQHLEQAWAQKAAAPPAKAPETAPSPAPSEGASKTGKIIEQNIE